MLGFLVADGNLGPVLFDLAHGPSALFQDHRRVELGEVGPPVFPGDLAPFFEVRPDLLFGIVAAGLAEGLPDALDDVSPGLGGQPAPEGGVIPLRHVLKGGFRRGEDVVDIGACVRGPQHCGNRQAKEEGDGR